MRIKHIELNVIEQPLKIPFHTSYGTYEKRESIIIKMIEDNGAPGYGEVVAFSEPWYTEETIQTALHVLELFLIPLILGKDITHPSEVSELFKCFKGHHMAKAGLEGALWDLYSRQQNLSLAKALGGTREDIPVGVVVSLANTEKMIQQIKLYKQEGYERFKVKVDKQRDYEIVSTIREHFPKISLMIDANSAYTIKDINQLKRLDEFDLLMIEQPFGDREFIEHAELQKEMNTSICLDESIQCVEDVKLAIAIGACRVINVKPGRVGGLTESLKIHDYAIKHDIPLWVGGMIETGISRVQNIALASLPGFTIPGDISASSRHWEEDLIRPEVQLQNGRVLVPQAAGIGVEVDEERIERLTKLKKRF
jgi:O-succinylbenzoate synthase